MALFSGVSGPLQDTADQKNRTNTKLQAGTHDAPGEKFVIDPRLPRLFRYHFGGDGWVKIPKGRIVAPATNGGPSDDGRFVDMDAGAGFKYPAITLANGGVDVTEFDVSGDEYVRSANIPIGVAHANLYEEFVDGFNGMQPTVENEIYIELPYIPAKEDAYEIGWGALYDKDIANPIKAGDFVMSDEMGYFVKADFKGIKEKIAAAPDFETAKSLLAELARMQEQVVGQVWTVENELAGQGWLKWVGWSKEQTADDNNPSGARPSDLGTQDGFPGYPYEKSYMNWDTKTNKYFPTGIPGLTNGSNIVVNYEDEVIGTVNPGLSARRYDLYIQRTPIVDGTVEIKVNGTKVTPDYVDTKSGRVILTIDSTNFDTPVKVTASYKATGQVPGVPTNLDFTGSVGAVRILLQK